MHIRIMKLEDATLFFVGLTGRTDTLAGGMQIISGLHPHWGKIAITIGTGSDVVVASERHGAAG